MGSTQSTWAAYETTLMKYHPWVVQKAAKLAMGLLPTKKGLIDKLVPSGDPEEIKKAIEDLPRAVEAMKKVYSATQVFYKEKNLLDIPKETLSKLPLFRIQVIKSGE